MTSPSPALPTQSSWQWSSACETSPPSCATVHVVFFMAAILCHRGHTGPHGLNTRYHQDWKSRLPKMDVFELQAFHPVQFGIMPRRLSTRQCDDDIIAVLEHDTSSIGNDYAARVVGDERTVRSRHMAMKGSAEPILRPAHGEKKTIRSDKETDLTTCRTDSRNKLESVFLTGTKTKARDTWGQLSSI